MEYAVRITFDEEAAVWIAESDEIIGLVLECGSLNALMERVQIAVPELLVLNKQPSCDKIQFKIEQQNRI